MHGQYLERYLRGEEQVVWHELVALGAVVREEPLAADVEAVVRETMRRVRLNIEVLIVRLRTLGYQFLSEYHDEPADELARDMIREARNAATYVADDAERTPPLTPLDDAEHQVLRDCEVERGPLPLSLRFWYEEIGSVDFSGYHLKLNHHQVVCPNCYEPTLRAPLADPLDVASPHLWNAHGGRVWAIGGDADSKAGFGPGQPMGILLPNASIDAPLVSPQWQGMLFMDYIRLALQWGGFPGFHRLPASAGQAREELAFLTKDLLPV